MRYAIFTLSVNGLRQAKRVRNALAGDVDIYVREKIANEEDVIPYRRVAEVAGQVFTKYSALIFIMATGIVVRSIAPFLVSKLSDPAVIVMDEQGRNIISLLSGHVGGANALTEQLAKKLGANPVITTATDVNGMLAPDLLASRIGLCPVSKAGILTLNSALLQGQDIKYVLDDELPRLAEYQDKLQVNGINPTLMPGADVAAYVQEVSDYVVIITNKVLLAKKTILYLKPRKLVAGVGCRRGTDAKLILQALQDACRSIGWSVDRIDEMASSVVKADEKGLLVVSQQLGKNIRFWENEALQRQIDNYRLSESEFVKKTIGVGNVSEAAAYCCVDHGITALPKTKYTKVTVALVWEK